MGMRRWPFVAECDVSGDHGMRLVKEPKPRCAVCDSLREQLENFREVIDQALRQLSDGRFPDRDPGVEQDIFSYGPQGAD